MRTGNTGAFIECIDQRKPTDYRLIDAPVGSITVVVSVVGARTKETAVMKVIDGLDRVNCPSREEFETHYANVDKTVIPTGVIDDWPASHKRDLAYLDERVGHVDLSDKTPPTGLARTTPRPLDETDVFLSRSAPPDWPRPTVNCGADCGLYGRSFPVRVGGYPNPDGAVTVDL